MRIPRLACLGVLFLPLATAMLSGCGVAESIAERFVDDSLVVVDVRPDRSGTLIRTADGTDVEVRPDAYFTGDRLTGTHAVCVLGFPLGEGTQLPDRSEIDRVSLHVWVEATGGTPQELAPLVLSHLPAHPDTVLTPGLVPSPPGNDLDTRTEVSAAGWRVFDVTQAFLQDFNGGKTISVFALRLAQPNDGDLEDDVLALENPVPGGKARLEVTLSLDL